MALAALPGAPLVPIGLGFAALQGQPASASVTLDAANEAAIAIGQVCTSDGGSHTIDTSGSSSLGWRAGTVTFANAGTTVKVGLAAVLTTVGPPGRAANTADVIDFDVSKSLVGGGGGITANAWQTHVPDTGSKTIAHGDMVAVCVQMTARGGTTDSVNVSHNSTSTVFHRPFVSQFTGGTYNTGTSLAPNIIITFSDGAIGYFQGSDVGSTIGSRSFSNSSPSREYGQLFELPFPMKLNGVYAWVTPSADFDIVLYSDPLGSPVAERTVSIDANTVSGIAARRLSVEFSSPYTTTASQKIVVAFKPGASNISAFFKTLASATHRVADPYGTSGYGVSRATGAFANANSSLDHYYIGLLAGAFDGGGASTRDNMFLVM